jgi:ribonucleoside-diphosphate reductase alpha chain
MDQLRMSSLDDLSIKETSPLKDFHVTKRDGSFVSWDTQRITRAIALAYHSVLNGPADANKATADTNFGLDDATFEKALNLTGMVESVVVHRFAVDEAPSIERIQDIVETCIATQGDWEVARAYVIYRTRQAELRPHHYAENGLQDYIAIARYSRYRKTLGRREVWDEAVERVRNMHLRKFAHFATTKPKEAWFKNLEDEGKTGPEFRSIFGELNSLTNEIWDAFELVKSKSVLPSMRSLQFGGKAIEAVQARLYNCSFSYADRPAFFREALYLMLCGVGVGFSVQTGHIEKIPPLPVRGEEMELPAKHFTVEDSIEGWSDAIDALIQSYYEGYVIEFNFSQIRGRGDPIKTAGGKAPGHLPLKRSIREVSNLLKGASGRNLRPIEVYDCVMHLAQAVLSGGVRRSATICLFSPEDAEMANAKTGNWFETSPQRSFSNNSALLDRNTVKEETFLSLFERQKQFGEPGFYFASSSDYGANPCVEIGLFPQITLTEKDITKLELQSNGNSFSVGDTYSGWQMCNLSTINGASPENRSDFFHLCKYGSLIGTLQAAYTDIPYLGPISRLINEKEALLGVSICGILDNPTIMLNPETLAKGAEVVRGTNAIFAKILGISPASRTTCVKPEGTASLLLGAGSGIHPHHAKRYFRRVQANRIDPVYQFFKTANAHMTEKSAYNQSTDDIITFPVEAPPGAICRNDLTALEFLKIVMDVQKHWVESGQADNEIAPGLHHNVSNTVTVKEEEWEDVANFVWENRYNFTGVALLQSMGDKVYLQSPREEIATEEDVRKWNTLKYQKLDYTQMSENADNTSLQDTAACAGGSCEINIPEGK